ncbi:cation:proton antiporter [Terricaulis sp.]|uniref:cation:proton antiporter n=1 Tax=Terricaulis sp. TaxID=2768686 RepID=UPI0037853183
MELFEWTLVLLFIAVLLTGFSRRIGAPYPSLLALAGAGLAFLPSSPDINIDPELALALFIAPVLLDAAYDTSPRDLKRNLLPLLSLVLVLVALTVAAVAFVGVHWAGLPLAAAIALGAIVAPPDAVAAAAVLGTVKLPRRILQILQGESLFNDAPALLIYRFAVVAAVSSGLTLAEGLPIVALAAVGSVVVGFALAHFYVFATRRVTDAASSTVLSFVGSFGIWILAERLGLSAIVTVVVYAMTLSSILPTQTSPRLRVSTYSVWETGVFVLNVLAFVMMGLQVRPIIERLSDDGLTAALWFSGAVLATVIVVRLGYVMLYNLGARVKNARFGVDLAEGLAPPTWKSGVLIGWCGMRGLVTLATAFALPEGFPSRDVIVLAAFTVVIGTLVVQGLTLKPLLGLLAFRDDNAVEEEVSRGRIAIFHTALDEIGTDASPEARTLREGYLAALKVAASDTPQAATSYDKLKLSIIPKQRAALAGLRERGEIGDEAFHRLEEELDWAELNAAPAGHFQPLTTDAR